NTRMRHCCSSLIHLDDALDTFGPEISPLLRIRLPATGLFSLAAAGGRALLQTRCISKGEDDHEPTYHIDADRPVALGLGDCRVTPVRFRTEQSTDWNVEAEPRQIEVRYSTAEERHSDLHTGWAKYAEHGRRC